MASTVARLEAILSANTRDFDRAMDRSHGKVQKMGAAAKLGGLALAGGLAYGLEKAFHAGMDAQVSQARLTQSFKQAHLSAHKYTKRIEEQEKASRRLGFADDEVRNSLGSLLVATNSYKQSVQDLGIAQNLARFKGVSLEQATKALTMAHAGSLKALKALGLQVSKSTVAVDTLRAHTKLHSGVAWENALALAKNRDIQATLKHTLETVSAATKNQGKAFSGTAAGGLAMFHAQVGHLEEIVGKKLLTAFTSVERWLVTNWPQISLVLKQVWQSIKPTLVALIDLVVAVVTTIRKHWGTIGPIVAGVAAVIKAQLAVITNIIRFFAALLRGDWSAAWGALKGIAKAFLDGIHAYLGLWKTIFASAAHALGHAIVEGVKLGINAGWELLKTAVRALFGQVIGWVKDVLGIHSPSQVFHGIGRNLVKGFANGIGSAKGLLKKAVVGMVKGIAGKFTGLLDGGGSSQGSRGYTSGGLQPQVLQAVAYARQHGWQGQVTSGFRSYAEQAALYQRYLAGGPLAAPPGHSSHESGSAVDVTDYATFGRIMSSAPAFERLYNHLGARDPVHYSISGYEKGGVVPGYGAQLAVVHGGETITPAGRGGGTHFYFPNYVGSKQDLINMLKSAMKQDRRRGGLGFA